MSDMGPDAEFIVEITADAAKAAAAIEAAVSKALAEAMKSKAGRDAINNIINGFLKGFAKVGNAQQNMWAKTTAAGQKSAQTVGSTFENMFKRVGSKSNQAFKLNQARGSAPELQALNALVADLANNFATLATDARSFNTVLTQMATSARAQLAAVTQEQRTLQNLTTSQNATLNTQAQERANQLTNQTKLQLAAIRSQSAADRNASNERIANIRRFTQIATTTIRSLTQVFRTVFNGATVILRNAVNAMQATIRGIANAFRAAFQAINGIVRSFASGFARAFSGIGRGVTSALAGVSRAIRSALSRDEAATKASMNRRERMAQHSAGQQRNFLTTAFQASGLAGGAAGIFNILSSGFERFSQVETLQFRFERFLGSAQKAKDLIQDLSDFARTTAFDLPGVANLATNFLAMGQSASEATANVRKLADVTAFAGGNTESLERIQRALGQIISTGKLQGDELNQLAENLPGINIRQIIADQMGVTTAELVKMQESGDISADAFITAFLTGIDDPRFEGAAVAIAGTLQGRLANLKESFGIFGAEIIGLAYGPISTAMTRITGFLSVAGDFISGDMFRNQEPVHAEDNPFVQMADDALIAFEDLPKEWQNQLGNMFGWTAGAGYVVSKADAVAWWDAMHPPEADETISLLEKLRNLMGDFAKGVGAGAAVAGGFKAIGLALRFMTSPLALAIGLFGTLGVFWGRIRAATPELTSSLDLVKQAFGNVRDTLGKTFGLVTDLLSTAMFGKPDFFRNIGLKVRDFANHIGNMTNRFNNWLKRINELLKVEGGVRLVFESISRHVQDFAASLLGLTDAQQEAAQALGGNDFGNIFTAFLDKLENVPVLGPIIGFARRVVGAIVEALKGAWAFAGDIWSLVFGGGEDDPTDTMVGALFGGEGDTRSTGQKILDRLEETFLGPIVRFFRGPFMDGIHAVGGFITGLWDRFLFPGFEAVTSFFAEDFLPGIANIASAIGNFFRPAIQTLGGLLGQVGTLLAPIGGAIQRFIGTWQDEGIGGALSSLWDGVTESAGNLWDGEDGNGGIKAGLQGAIDKITTWFSDTFTGKNVSGWIMSALNGIRQVGYAIGKVIGSPEFLGTVIISAAAVAAAVAAVLGAFTLGLVQGLAKEGVRWGKLIAGALQDGWNALAKGALSFIPQPVVDAVNAMLGSPIIGTGIALGLGLLAGKIVVGLGKSIMARATPTAIIAGGPGGGANFATLGLSIATSLVKSVVSGFTQVGRGAKSLAQMILPTFPKDGNTERTVGSGIGSRVVGGFNSFFRTVKAPFSALSTAMTNIKNTAKEKFGSVGTAIATAVIGGIASFEMGMYAGRRGGAGGVILALLGGAATGGSIGAAFGVPGAAIGAAIGVGLAGLGAAIGASGAAAAKAKDEVNEYRDALVDLSDTVGSQDLATSTILANLRDESEKVNQFLVDAKFNARQLADDVLSGDFNLGETFSGLLDTFVSTPDAGALSDSAYNFLQRLQDGFRDAVASGEPINLNELIEVAGGIDAEDNLKEIKDAGFDVVGAFDAINDEASELGQGVELKQLATDLEGVAGAGGEAADAIDTVEEGLSLIRTALAAGAGGWGIAQLLGHTDLSTAQSLEAIGDAADEVKKQLDDAVSAFEDALKAFETPGTVQPETFRGVTDAFLANLPEMEAAYNSMLEGPEEGVELNVVIANARKNESAREFQDTLSGMIAQGAAEGLIVDDASMDTFLNELKAKLTAAGVSATDGAAGEMMFTMIDSFIAGDFSQMLDPITGALTNEAVLAEAARQAAGIFYTAFGGAQGAATALGGPAALGQAVGTGAASTAPTQEIAITVKPVTQEDFAGAFTGVDAGAVGTDLSQGVADKLPDQFHTATGPMKNELNAVGNSLHGTATSSGFLVGTKFTKSVGSGVRSAASEATGAMTRVMGGIRLAAASGNGGMENAGSNLARSLARGIRGSAVIAVMAAAAMARAVIQAVQSILQIGSPSKVFITIGRQIGEGFMEGIEDSEGDMAAAISTAIENAVKTAKQTAGLAIARAEVAGTIFDLLQPSPLPGGTTYAELQSAQLTLQVDLAGFVNDLRDALAEALGDTGNIGRADAQAAVAGVRLDLASAFNDATEEFNDAMAHADEIADYAAALKELKAELAEGATGTLGREARDRLRAEAAKELKEEKGKLADRLKVLKDQYDAGKINKKDYDEAVKSANEAYNTGPLQAYYEELAAIERHFKDGTLAAQEYKDQLEALGEKPEPLSFEEKGIIASGPDSLNPKTAIGQENRDAINDALDKIKQWGQEALAAGTPMATVVAKMKEYIAQLMAQAKAAGFNAKEVQALIDAYGLSSAELAELAKEATSLDVNTTAGMENTQTLNEKLQDIRDYASMLLKAGVSTEEVTKQIKAMRKTFIDAAKAAGFNAADIQKLVEQMGLSDSALAKLIEQLKAFDAATTGATAAAQAAANAANGGVARPVGEVHVHVPYGDPEAVAMATANALAYGGPTNW